MNNILKNLFAGIIITAFTIPLFSQKPAYLTAKHIKPQKTINTRFDSKSLYKFTGEEFLVSNTVEDGFLLTIYSVATLKKKDTFLLRYPTVGSNDPDWIEPMFEPKSTTTIYGYYDQKAEINTIYGQITDRNGTDIVKQKVLAKIPTSRTQYIGSLGRVLSKDKSKILIYREKSEWETDKEFVELWVFDNHLKTIYKKKMKFPYKSRKFFIQNYTVTNEGKVIINAYYLPSKEEIKANPDSKSNFLYKIFFVSEDDELQEIKFENKGAVLHTVTGFDLDSGKFVFTGYYREAGEFQSKYGSHGVYYIKMNTDDWIIQTSQYNKIPKEDMIRIFEANVATDREIKKSIEGIDKGGGLVSYTVPEIFYNDDGSVKIISEIQFTDYSGYNNNQIIEFDMDGKGRLVKTVVIPKKQVTESFDFTGYIALMSNSRMYYIFNDAEQNFDEKKLAKNNGNMFYYEFKDEKKARLAYAYQKKSNEPAKVAMSMDDNNIVIDPSRCIWIDERTAITWGKLAKSEERFLIKIFLQDK